MFIILQVIFKVKKKKLENSFYLFGHLTQQKKVQQLFSLGELMFYVVGDGGECHDHMFCKNFMKNLF